MEFTSSLRIYEARWLSTVLGLIDSFSAMPELVSPKAMAPALRVRAAKPQVCRLHVAGPHDLACRDPGNRRQNLGQGDGPCQHAGQMQLRQDGRIGVAGHDHAARARRPAAESGKNLQPVSFGQSVVDQGDAGFMHPGQRNRRQSRSGRRHHVKASVVCHRMFHPRQGKGMIIGKKIANCCHRCLQLLDYHDRNTPFAARIVVHPKVVVPFLLPPGHEAALILRYRSEGSPELSFALHTEQGFEHLAAR